MRPGISGHLIKMRVFRVNQHLGSCIIFFSLFLIQAGTVAAQESDNGFSAPINMAEVALDAVLSFDTLATRDDRFGPFMEFMLGYPDRNTGFDHLYEAFFTPALLQAWRKAERDQVVQDCGGRYVEGELCGLGFSPLTCGQDEPPAGYVYNTQMETSQYTLVAAAWKGWEEPIAVYRMVLQNGQWRLDGVYCQEGYRFN